MNIRRTINGIVWSAATLLLLLSGCVKENSDTPGRKDGKARISFSAPIIVEQAVVSAQQAYGKAQSTTRAALTEKTTVRVVAFTSTNPAYSGDQAYFVDSDGKLKPCTVNADGSFKSVDMTGELALYPDKYDFYAITPALPLGANKNSVTVLNGIDYASSVTSNINVSNDQTLTLTQLDRKCAKIALVIKKGDDNTLMTALSVASGGVTINNLAPSATTASLNATIAQASGTATLNVPQSVFKTISATETSAITYLLPRLGENRINLTYNLTYTVSGTSETKNVSGSMGNIALESGKSYTFTLTMRQAGASIAVKEWIDGGSQDVVAGESFNYGNDDSAPFFVTNANIKNPIDESDTMNWYIANGITDATYNLTGAKACPTGWRVPTINELALIWIYNSAFPSNFAFSANYYWSSEQLNNTEGLSNYMNNETTTGGGRIGGTEKYKPNPVRCVRKTSFSTNTATKVVSNISGQIIIDSRHVRSKGFTTTPKITTTVWKDTNSPFASGMDDIASQENNAQVYYYFEVDKNDTSGETWLNAINECASKPSDSNSKWRLPTQRELMLMRVLRDDLEKIPDFQAFSKVSFYWSATERGKEANVSIPNIAWYVDFDANIVTTNYKSALYRVRCVRDVVPSDEMFDYSVDGSSGFLIPSSDAKNPDPAATDPARIDSDVDTQNRFGKPI